MEKIIKTMLAVMAGALTFSACSSEESVAPESSNGAKETKVFTASQEDNTAVTSRTAIDDTNSKQIDWQSTDKVAIIDNTMTTKKATCEFVVSPNSSDPSKATLYGLVYMGSSKYIAVYPKSAAQTSAVYSSDAVTVTIPTTQTATAGSFDPAAAVMTASSTSASLSFEFKNVCSFLKIVTNKEYAKVEVSVTSGDIAGEFVVVPSTGVISSTTTGAQTITLAPATGSDTFAAGTYYVAIAPGQVSGLTIKCYTSADTYIGKANSGTTTQTRTKVYAMGGPGTWTKGFASVLSTASVSGNHVDWVQLWSGGPKYATINIGATSSTDYGRYFAWGDTKGYTSGHSFSWSNAPFNNGWSTYNSSYFNSTGRALATGSASGTTLVSTYDAATVIWGSNWKMPTKDNYDALISNCKGSFTSGYTFTGKTTGYTSNSISLPAAGFYDGTDLKNAGSRGYYLSSTLDDDPLYYAYFLCYVNSYTPTIQSESSYRYYGRPIRAILAE